jgi:hypothetical protein
MVSPTVPEAGVQGRKMYSNLSLTAKVPFQKHTSVTVTGIAKTVVDKTKALLENKGYGTRGCHQHS